MGQGWGKELVLQLGTVLHRIGVQFPSQVILFLYFVHVGFVLRVGLYSCNFFLSNQSCKFDMQNLCACLSCFKN